MGQTRDGPTTIISLDSVEERAYSEDLSINRRIILKLISEKLDVKIWIKLNCLEIGFRPTLPWWLC
jgi:hypothetical protein